MRDEEKFSATMDYLKVLIQAGNAGHKVATEINEAVRALRHNLGLNEVGHIKVAEKMPTVGDIVLYDDGTNWFPALVVRPMTNQCLNLKVFTDYSTGKDGGFQEFHLRNVPKGEGIRGGWRLKQ